MTQTKEGASHSKWLIFMRKVGNAWRQGKDALLIVLLQEILEESSDNKHHSAAEYQITIDALRDALLNNSQT